MHIAKRTLFHADVLGLSNYERQRASVQERIGDLRVSFRQRMENYMESDPRNTIFTDDLKTMVHVAEMDDLDTACKMIKRFHQQNNTLRFSTFVFGPLVLRMFHKLNEPQKALALFNDESLKGFFSQMSSYVVIMDLMFENQMYDDILKMMSFVSEQQLGGFKYPMDCVTLSTAACLKLNTPESLEMAVDLLKQCDAVQAMISLRSIIFSTLLALKQNNPSLALEVMSLAKPPSSGKLPLAFTNVKTLVYTKLARIEDAVQMLKAVISADTPDHVSAGSEIFQDILDELQKESEKETNKAVLRDLAAVEKALEQGSHINKESFDEYVLRPIMRKRKMQDGYKARQRSNRSQQTYHREGLMAKGERM
ncbi:Pentatricopeptide repeat-containing protein 2, mitochondrial [Lamellibrachia satsuma]|nr:Pentatricopeptide repeat-containing protein 2, mitochondrial [Lamellibrachia satsuma]